VGAAHRGHAERHGGRGRRAGEGLEGVTIVLVPDVTWRAGAFEGGVGVAIGPDGRIAAVGPAEDLAGAAGARREPLPRRALLPGFVNGHSHAFQRLLRGRAQWRPVDGEADFWTWREAMLALASSLSPDDIEAASRFAFLEMARAGFTAVGEFHYLRRDPAGLPYTNPHEIADRVIAAARDVGLRITLLDAAYAAGGIGAPLEPTQRRFATPDVDGFLAQLDDLRARWSDDPLVAVGAAAHSVRAVPRAALASIAEWAHARGTPLHAHVSEQMAEVSACVRAHGCRPVELLAEEGFLSPAFTAVHATHVDAAEIALLGGARASVCACPTTERDLGDGVLPSALLAAGGVDLALGTDSQVVVDPFEEMRALEGHERLWTRRRVAHGVARDGRWEAGPALLAMGMAHGARALGIEAGVIAPGAWADLVAVDLDHPALAGWSEATLAAHLALAAPAAAVADVWVGGVRRVEGGRHRLDGEAAAAFARIVARGS
jgi:formimidoylglutamate deiminase